MKGIALADGGTLAPRLALGGEDVIRGPPELPAGARESAVLDALPGKRPLIKRSYRPPNYETPIEYFQDAFTPNDAFFVRYHLAIIPEVSAASWKLEVSGDSK